MTVSSWLELTEENRGTDRFKVSYAAFRSIVQGHAPALNDLTRSLDVPRNTALELIHHMASEGRLRLDSEGSHVIGAAGLSLEPSRHGLMMSGRPFGVWCALDAVGIPAGLDADALVESRCALTGAPISVQIEQGSIVTQSPGNLLISLVPASVARSVHDSLCNRILFYSEIPKLPNPDAEYLPIEEVADLGRRLWRDGIPL